MSRENGPDRDSEPWDSEPDHTDADRADDLRFAPVAHAVNSSLLLVIVAAHATRPLLPAFVPGTDAMLSVAGLVAVAVLAAALGVDTGVLPSAGGGRGGGAP